jgi:hypothetical protein
MGIFFFFSEFDSKRTCTQRVAYSLSIKVYKSGNAENFVDFIQ